MLTLADPFTLAGIVIVAGFFSTRYWRQRSLPAYYLIRVAVFTGLTVLLLKGGSLVNDSVAPVKSQFVPL